MKEEILNNRLQEIITTITKIPKNKQTIKESGDKTTRLINDLSVCVEYMMLDIESTRREKDNLKRILDELHEDDENTMEGGV